MGYEFIKLVKLSGDKKKYKAVLKNKETGREKSVKFGATGMMDYTKYYKKDGKEVADMKKKAYIARHSKAGEDWTASGKDTAGFFSKHILWSEPTIEASLSKMIKKFF
jgi:hypothetical protein